MLQQLMNPVPRPPLPTYRGADHEDPKRFILKCNDYFQTTHTSETLKTTTASSGLQGDAAKWWVCYQLLDFEWDKFQELLLNQYDSPAVLSRLNAQLFSRKQGEKESAGIYLQQKYLLYQRLRTEEPELTKVSTLLELLRPSLRIAVRPTNPMTFAMLMTKAIEAEHDLAETVSIQPSRYLKKEDTQRVDKPARPPADGQYPPRCWHCPERHLHKDCPVLAQKKADQTKNQGNSTQASGRPNPTANQR